MEIKDILPIASISFMIAGFIIILIGCIWMANTMSKGEQDISFANTEDIIGEMNEMFAYFTDQIDQKNKIRSLKTSPSNDRYSSQNTHYANVIELRKTGHTPDQIAKKLDIGKGEVNLILGIDQMR